MRDAESLDFHGTRRFEICSCLGTGGMGMVYAALDRERNVRVALKTLRKMTAETLLRFKNEFRALQDLQHPNLVSLGELYQDEGRWFFTMELVSGVHFLDHVRPGQEGKLNKDTSLLAVTMECDLADESPRVDLPPATAFFDEARLRSSLAQLAQGLLSLHSAGKVHRDIKPSNILVEPSGRVVVVDFGLVTDVRDGGQSELRAIGTSAYMAPEQARASRVGPAADWYSVGVMLYQVLTGRLPFEGQSADILGKKLRSEPPPPRALSPHVPADLDALCVALLRTDASARPTEVEILRRLCPGDAHQAAAALATPSMSGPPFVDRDRELGMLRRAFADSQPHGSETAVTVLVHGESGVGKSALVHRFVENLRAERPEVVVLEGRCYEREAVPYKAIDGVVDALSRFLKKLPKIEAVGLLPTRAVYLAQVFLALRQVEAIAELPSPGPSLLDPQEMRSRVFTALRQLLVRLAARHAVLLVIDDLQWADADSLALLRDLLRPPEAPPLLLVSTVRSAEEQGGTRNEGPALDLAGDVRYLHLGCLPRSEAEELASLLMKGTLGDPLDLATAIADDADGHPLFIDALVRHTLVHGKSTPRSLRLEDALWERISALDPTARFVLELLVVSGGPLARAIVAQAAQTDEGELEKRISILRVTHLVKTAGLGGSNLVEWYHDRVRDTVLGHMEPSRKRTCHERLALALEASGDSDSEALALHFSGAGKTEPAAHHAVRAGDQAGRALAFEHAARLYRWALELGAPREECLRKLADALANAGRGGEAGDVFLEAAAVAPVGEALALRRLATDQYLISGHIDQGLAVLRTVLAEAQMPMPKTAKGALLSLALRRAQIRLRGLSFTRHDESQISPKELERCDLCWSVARGLPYVDFIGGADYQSRHLVWALRSGDAFRITRALCGEAAYVASGGGRTAKRSAHLLKEAETLSSELQRPYTTALYIYSEAIVALLQGRFRRLNECATQADAIFRERCTGAAWELSTLQTLMTISLHYLGELKELRRVVACFLREDLARGDLYGATAMRVGDSTVAWLAADNPTLARQEATIAGRGWSQKGVVVQNYLELASQVQIDLYQEEGAIARHRLKERWLALERSLLLHVQFIRVVMRSLRARAALAEAHAKPKDSPERERLVRAAERDAKSLIGERMPWTIPLGHLHLACAALAQNEQEGALALFEQAEEGFRRADMALHAAAARQRQGELLGGDEGRARITEVDSWMQAQDIVNPRRMVSLLAPGPH